MARISQTCSRNFQCSRSSRVRLHRGHRRTLIASPICSLRDIARLRTHFRSLVRALAYFLPAVQQGRVVVCLIEITNWFRVAAKDLACVHPRNNCLFVREGFRYATLALTGIGSRVCFPISIASPQAAN